MFCLLYDNLLAGDKKSDLFDMFFSFFHALINCIIHIFLGHRTSIHASILVTRVSTVSLWLQKSGETSGSSK